MKALWQSYSQRFLSITLREQLLILITGLIAIVFITHTLLIDENQQRISAHQKEIKRLTTSIATKQQTIGVFEQALQEDPNEKITRTIHDYERDLQQVDIALLTLTSDLIDPVQMRFALTQLLALQKGVKLLSFEVIGAEPMALPVSGEKGNAENQPNESSHQSNDKVLPIESALEPLVLYKHGLRIKLSGRYFQLRDYLKQLEQMQYRFFWQRFDYQLVEYPLSEVEIELYSLSTKQEFVGV
ncbi:hypothetical protein [Thalassotalea ganghwensis]